MKKIKTWFKLIFMTFALTSTIWMDTLLFPFRKKRVAIPLPETKPKPGPDLNDLKLQIVIQNYRLTDLEMFLVKVANYAKNPDVKQFEKIKMIAEGLSYPNRKDRH